MTVFRRWSLRVCALLVCFGVAGILLSRDRLLKALVRNEIEKHAGLEAQFGTFRTTLFQPSLKIEGLTLRRVGPASSLVSASVPELFLELSPSKLFSRQLHFPQARLSVSEVVIEQPKGAPSDLAIRLEDWNASVKTLSPQTNSVLGFRFVGIDRLQLSLGMLKLANASSGAQVSEVELALKDQVITNVHSLEDLSNLVLKALVQNGITIVPQGGR